MVGPREVGVILIGRNIVELWLVSSAGWCVFHVHFVHIGPPTGLPGFSHTEECSQRRQPLPFQSGFFMSGCGASGYCSISNRLQVIGLNVVA